MGASSNPQTQVGNNIPFQQPPVRPRQTLNTPNQNILSVPIGNPYQMGGYQSMPPPYPRSSPYPPNQYTGVHMARLVSIPCHLSTITHFLTHLYLSW